MKFGAVIFATDRSIGIVELARALEQHGFESLWLPEHTHIPASRLTPWPGGAPLPDFYARTLDPFVALTAAAVATTTLRLGTGVCLVTQRDPLVTAKEVASLDLVSGGRFEFGIGAGWNREELASHGTEYTTRWRLLRERVEAMKAIWTQDETAYRGAMVDLEPLWSWPKPVQKPHPPILMGGNGPGALGRIVAYCDAWIPIPSRGEQSFDQRIPELQRLAAEAGRGPIPISVFQAEPDRAEIERLAGLGVERFIFGLPSAGADEVLPLVRERAKLIAAFA